MSATALSDEAKLEEIKKEREAFIERVREGERLAAADPASYRKGLRRLVWCGYAYIVGVVVLAFLASIASIALLVVSHSGGLFKLVLIPLAFLYLVLKSLWVRSDKVEGLVVTRSEAPELWREVDAIADRLQVRRAHEIRLDTQFNAAAIQRPGLFGFGRPKNTLLLGLQLLFALDPDEARSVIAHEFGHLSALHAQFGHWVYRVYQRWEQLGENLSGSPAGNVIFRPFVGWFLPRFAAMSFAIRRQDEFEADQASVQAVGAEPAVRAFARTTYASEQIEEGFWNPLGKRVCETGFPEAGFLMGLAGATKTASNPETANRSLRLSLNAPTNYDDSHPSTADRIRAMGQPIPQEVPPPITRSAAEAFFGNRLSAIVGRVENEFVQRVGPIWSKMRQEHAETTKRREELEALAENRPLMEDEAVELAACRAQTSAETEALPIYRELHKTYPENAYAQYLLGEKLLAKDDAEGVALLETAARLKPELVGPVRQEIAAFRARQGDFDSVERLREEAMADHARQQIAEASSALQLNDEMLPPDLTEGERERLRASLVKLKGLGQAYAVRKRLPGTGEIRDYLYLVVKNLAWVGDNRLAHFVKQFDENTDLARPFTIMADDNQNAWRKKFRTVEGSLVFDAKEID